MIRQGALGQLMLRQKRLQLPSQMAFDAQLCYLLDVLMPMMVTAVLVWAFFVLWLFERTYVRSKGTICFSFVVMILYALYLMGVYLDNVRYLLVKYGLYQVELASFHTILSGLLLGWSLLMLPRRMWVRAKL